MKKKWIWYWSKGRSPGKGKNKTNMGRLHRRPSPCNTVKLMRRAGHRCHANGFQDAEVNGTRNVTRISRFAFRQTNRRTISRIERRKMENKKIINDNNPVGSLNVYNFLQTFYLQKERIFFSIFLHTFYLPPSSRPRCSSYWKGSLRVTLDKGLYLWFFSSFSAVRLIVHHLLLTLPLSLSLPLTIYD